MPVLNHLGQNYYIPDNIIKQYCHLYTDDDWSYTTAYYFKKGKKKTKVEPGQQKPDYIVTKLSKYDPDTFYKLTNNLIILYYMAKYVQPFTWDKRV